MLQQAMERFTGKTLIRNQYDNYIDGQWVAPVKGGYPPLLLNPFNFLTLLANRKDRGEIDE